MVLIGHKIKIWNIAIIFLVSFLVVFYLYILISKSNPLLLYAEKSYTGELDTYILNEIEDALEDQRRKISNEMSGYRYPDKDSKIPESYVTNLVPESGGIPVRIIIISTWRSGSTFLAAVLNSHPAMFYHYEPLSDYDYIQIREEPLSSDALQNMKKLLNCNYSHLDHYLKYSMNTDWIFSHNTRLWEHCKKRPQICYLPEFLNPFCRLFPFQTMKIVRLRLQLVETLLQNPSLNIKVLLLVRDPRGIIQSRKHKIWCRGNPYCSDVSNLCDDLVSDYNAAVEFKENYPKKFRVTRYEDLSTQLYEVIPELFQFFELDYHSNVKCFLDSHTKVDIGVISRNSKSVPFRWRQYLTYQEVDSIQKVCSIAMKNWGYVNAYNISHQRVFNPVGHFTL